MLKVNDRFSHFNVRFKVLELHTLIDYVCIQEYLSLYKMEPIYYEAKIDNIRRSRVHFFLRRCSGEMIKFS